MSNFSLVRKRGLIYPGSSYGPGFNPNHIAGTKVLFSGVATINGANFINIFNGMKGTVSPTPAVGRNGIIGPFLDTRAAGSGGGVTFSGIYPATTSQNPVTLAGIVLAPATLAGAELEFIETSTTDANAKAGTNTTNTFTFTMPGTANVDSLIPLVANTPYFYATSYSSSAGKANFLVLNLRTGQVTTSVISQSGTPGNGNGNIVIGNDANNIGGGNPGLATAAAMFSNNYLSISALRIWATDPWSFWYPGSMLGKQQFQSITITDILYPAIVC